MFEQLASADLFVHDSQRAYDVLRGPLGLFEPRGIWRQVWPDWGFDARWCRTNLDLAVSPTHVEIIAPLDSPDPSIGHPQMRAMYDAQGGRLYKTHSTPIAVDDVEELARRLSRAGAIFRLDEPEGELPFPRLWLGRAADRPGDYDPTSDGGLYLEFVPALNFPTKADDTKQPPAGHPVKRVSARTMIVDDIDSTLTTLDHNLGWSPSAAVARRRDDRVAVFTFDHPGSAALEVVEPGERGPAREYHQAWGFGPYALALEVTDRASAVAALVEGGLLEDDPGTDVIRPDYRRTFGVQLEFHDGERSST
ncbi:hypothetical protein [Actinomadura rugatobispora]|uniref:VOC family protein n=1 Tax=Actinomadura rugatobispora TaxID=1994 RepID=A0ABW0ZRW2_9ACTN|nr:hypothetical protein GCM10010200_002360 [Actinomadura rugatobispora]